MSPSLFLDVFVCDTLVAKIPGQELLRGRWHLNNFPKMIMFICLRKDLYVFFSLEITFRSIS